MGEGEAAKPLVEELLRLADMKYSCAPIVPVRNAVLKLRLLLDPDFPAIHEANMAKHQKAMEEMGTDLERRLGLKPRSTTRRRSAK